MSEKAKREWTRRQTLMVGAGMAGVAMMPGFSPLALADDQPPIGTWPAGSSGDSVTIGAAVPRVVTSDSLNLRYGLLATGRFVTLIPGSALHYGPQRAPIKVLPIEIPRWSIPLCVVTLKGRTLSPIGQLFIDSLRELAKVLEKGTHLRRR